jgi:anti-anti-sigma regulatory factor
MSASPPSLSIGRSDGRYVMRVAGRGTWKESVCAQQLAAQCLDGAATSLVIDLSECDYLDSTFLGCLVEMRRRFNGTATPRVEVIAEPVKRAQLFGHSRVDTILKFTNVPAEMPGEWAKVPISDSSDTARHIMDCHRALAELGSPDHAKFTKIADHLAREIGDGGGKSAAGKQ